MKLLSFGIITRSMAHSDSPVVCPNCGFQAQNNYCAQCGQQNHLHKDTTWSLIMHFFEHYFHYDNKFWQTMRTLFVQPGKLATAYWNNQRQRYISPVSLYIFISAIYFISYHFVITVHENKVMDSIKKDRVVAMDTRPGQADNKAVKSDFERGLLKIQRNPEILKPFIGDVEHNVPRVMFFMIPITGLLLKLFFLKRKDLFFVDHVIFSLHWHSFYFAVGTIFTLLSLIPYLMLITLLTLIIYPVYFAKAVKNAYNVGSAGAIGCTAFVAICYAAIYSGTGGYYFYTAVKALAAQP